jgi:hypothetical protein
MLTPSLFAIRRIMGTNRHEARTLVHLTHQQLAAPCHRLHQPQHSDKHRAQTRQIIAQAIWRKFA